MAPSNETDDPNDAALSDPSMEETTATKRQCLNSSTGTLTLTPPSSSSITPGDSLPTLPFEIVAEVLSMLPVKFLMQLKCVCKSWKSLISDAKFAEKHLRVSTTRHLVLLTFSDPSPEFVITAYPLSSIFTEVNPTATATKLQCPLSNRPRFDYILGSCHGILCIILFQSFVIMWNPSINKFTKLPSLECPRITVRCPTYGFGYDHSTHTYKVVAVSCTKCDNGVYQVQIHVHIMGTDYWRMIRADSSHHNLLCPGKLVSGTVNWLAYNESASAQVIVSLDLKTESYRELLQPDYGVMDVVYSTLDVLMDCLCILSSHTGAYSEVWLMKEYGNKDSWTKLFHVPYMDGVRSGPYSRALYVYEDDQVLLEIQSKLVVYNSRNGTFKTLQIQNTAGCMFPQVYQESLISPCS